MALKACSGEGADLMNKYYEVAKFRDEMKKKTKNEDKCRAGTMEMRLSNNLSLATIGFSLSCTCFHLLSALWGVSEARLCMV